MQRGVERVHGGANCDSKLPSAAKRKKFALRSPWRPTFVTVPTKTRSALANASAMVPGAMHRHASASEGASAVRARPAAAAKSEIRELVMAYLLRWDLS